MDRNQAFQCIVRQARAGELIFPTRMAATLRLQRALGDPDCRLDQIADMVLAEPLIAARLVAIANSVAYTRFGGHVSNVRKAVGLLGFRPLRALVAVIVVRQLAEEIKDPGLKHQARLLWHHSAQVAALAKIVAREFTAIDPETAMFAGVIHESDGFYLLSGAGELPELLAEWAGPLAEPDRIGPKADFKLEGKSLQGVLSVCAEEIQAVMDALLSKLTSIRVDMRLT